MLSKLAFIPALALGAKSGLRLKQEKQTLKVMVMNDIHTDLMYEADEEHGPLGSFGQDPPIDLLESVLKSVMEREGQPDILLIPGDFAAHGLSASSWSKGDYSMLLKTLKQVSSTIYRILGRDTLVLPTFGNNDVKNHYEPPSAEEKEAYYSKVFEMWFGDSKNPLLLENKQQMKETFL